MMFSALATEHVMDIICVKKLKRKQTGIQIMGQKLLCVLVPVMVMACGYMKLLILSLNMYEMMIWAISLVMKNVCFTIILTSKFFYKTWLQEPPLFFFWAISLVMKSVCFTVILTLNFFYKTWCIAQILQPSSAYQS